MDSGEAQGQSGRKTTEAHVFGEQQSKQGWESSCRLADDDTVVFEQQHDFSVDWNVGKDNGLMTPLQPAAGRIERRG